MSLRVLVPLLLCATTAGCSYARLLRPSVLKQLTPPMVELVNTLPDLDHPNETVLARLIGTGGLSHARVGADGVMRDRLRIPLDHLLYVPGVVVMPHGGELELEIQNEDEAVHLAVIPSNGVRQTLLLPQSTAGRIRVRLDSPGMYAFACPVSNHAGRGELGLILVGGETDPEGRLDRPAQPRPGR